MEQGRGGISGGDCGVSMIMRMVVMMTYLTREAVEESRGDIGGKNSTTCSKPSPCLRTFRSVMILGKS